MDNKHSLQIIDQIQYVYQQLEDEISRNVYMKRLAFLLSGDYKYVCDLKLMFMQSRPEWYSSGLALKNLFELHNLLPKDRDFVLYGAGKEGASIVSEFLDDRRFLGFCCRTKEKQERGYLGYPVMSPEELLARKDLSVIISTSAYKDQITHILLDGGYPQDLIFDGPAYYLRTPGEDEQYFGPSFMKFQEDEVFVDAGCLDFGSSLGMAKHCKRVKVYAFEPDQKSYLRCMKEIERRNKNQIPEVHIFNKGVWSTEGTLHMNMTGSGYSSICEKGTEIPVMTIDSAIDPGDRVTMIKMDVEGSELEALKGAKETIIRDKPKLAISIYHKTEDMWELPLYIIKLVPDYRLYLRHHSLEAWETVLYAVV